MLRMEFKTHNHFLKQLKNEDTLSDKNHRKSDNEGGIGKSCEEFEN